MFFSCNKDEDNLIPQIVIFSPSEFANYKIEDTIDISAKITDETNISVIEIVIVNTNYLPVTESIVIYPNTKSFVVNAELCIDDINLNSGTYYVKIRAYDGTNEKNLFRAVSISGIQREFKNIITVNQVNTNNFNIYKIDSVSTLLFTYQGDYISAAINNNYHQFYICGNVNSNLNTYNLNTNSLVWSVLPDNNPPFPSFENLNFDNDILYVSFSKSFVKGFNRYADINYTSTTISGYKPLKTIRFNNYFIVEEKSNVSDLRLLSTYYFPTGALKNSTNLPCKINKMFLKNNSEIYIFGNDLNNKAFMSWYHIENQTFYNPHSLPAAQLKDVVKLNANNYLIIIADKIYWYQEISNSLTVFADNINAEIINFEDISQLVVVSEGNKLLFFNFPTGSIVGEKTLNFPIKDILIQYKKK